MNNRLFCPVVVQHVGIQTSSAEPVLYHKRLCGHFAPDITITHDHACTIQARGSTAAHVQAPKQPVQAVLCMLMTRLDIWYNDRLCRFAHQLHILSQSSASVSLKLRLVIHSLCARAATESHAQARTAGHGIKRAAMACLPCQSRWTSVSAALMLEPASRTNTPQTAWPCRLSIACCTVQTNGANEQGEQA